MKHKQNPVIVVLVVLQVLLVAVTGCVIKLCLDLARTEPDPRATVQTAPPPPTVPATETTLPETTLPEPEHVVSTASIGATGDLLMHMTIFDDRKKYNAAVQQADGSYDFTSLFRYLSEYTSPLDYAVANLETTLCGEENGYPYAGYPLFNCPDSLVDSVKAAGFDMLLTANNHSYDTSMVGYLRTLDVVRGKGLETLGTYASGDETKWTVVDINGIQIGMLCYTWASYAAEATVLFLHWGVEYQLTANTVQQSMAQKLCDLGVDVVIGGHPHVIQPIELLESSVNPEHKTVCLYSTGNAVSNQRLGLISQINTAHTEDGILFGVTFEKYSDGTVYLQSISALPTWVNRFNNANGKTEYNILPLDKALEEEWPALFAIEGKTLTDAQASYDRTMAIVGEGLETVQTCLQQEKTEREAYYLDLVRAA